VRERILTEMDIARMMGDALPPLPDPEELERCMVERMCVHARARIAQLVSAGYLWVDNDVYRLTERGERVVATTFHRYLAGGYPRPPTLAGMDGCLVGREYDGVYSGLRTEKVWRRARRKVLESLSCEERAVIGLPVAKLLTPQEMVLRRMILAHCQVVNNG